MNLYSINGENLAQMVAYGASWLALDVDRINALNVFPVPDGDTGTNMKMTIDGGAKINNVPKHIGEASKQIARSMVLSARGNSGVILSQFFKGLSLGLEHFDEIDVKGFANAMVSGTRRSYSVVTKPTEGTILTVMREAGSEALKNLTSEMNLADYLKMYLNYANKALAKTPDLLPVLKKAGVIDSGGAGFILVIEGMLKAVLGEEIENAQAKTNTQSIDTSNFNADSELTYGYCTEFILQLQNAKVNPKTFDLNIIVNFLESIGNSIVAFKDDDIVKVHVHTFDPGVVLTECRKYGEFLTLKIENMNVSHTESENTLPTQKEEKVHKEYAVVAVANGSGLVNAFKDMGVDEVVTGGQTMNTSTEDFLKAFENIDADNILVYPNNGNIYMAAKIAAENYDKANVVVIPTKTIAEGYSAISMLDFDGVTIDDILEVEYEAIERVKTLEVTYAVRDAEINGINIKKDEFICLYNHDLISACKSRVEAVKNAFDSIPDFSEKEVLTLVYGADVNELEVNEIGAYAKSLNPFIEVYPIKGCQDIYSYIIGLE